MKRVMKYLVLFAIMLISVPCLAATPSKQTYMINGEIVTCNVIIKNNISYISLGDLENILGVYSYVNFCPSGETSGKLAISKDKESLKDYNYDIFYEVFENNVVVFDSSIFNGATRDALKKYLPFEQNDKFYVPLKTIAEAYKINVAYVDTKSNRGQSKTSLQVNSGNINTFFNMSYDKVIRKYGNNSKTIYLEGAECIEPSGVDVLFSFDNSKVSSITITSSSKSSVFGIKLGMSLSEIEKLLGKDNNAYDNIAGYTISGYDIWLNFDGNFSRLNKIMIKKSDY